MSTQTRNYPFINDAPYGNERPYNALRLAMNLAKRPETVELSLLNIHASRLAHAYWASTRGAGSRIVEA